MYSPIHEYYDLPKKYNETIVRLLVQSPKRMYAYWEISDGTIQKLRDNNINYEDFTPVLKISNITMNYSYEIEIDPYANNYYIDVEDSNCKYKVELGRRKKDKYVCVSESNTANVPTSMPGMDSDEVIYKNYIRLQITDRLSNCRSRFNMNNKQSYYGLNFSTEDSISSGNRYD